VADHVQADICPICSSPVYARMVPPTEEIPPLIFTCRCRQVYPERFTVQGQHGYGKTGFAGIRR
jgi:hypothetical protein